MYQIQFLFFLKLSAMPKNSIISLIVVVFIAIVFVPRLFKKKPFTNIAAVEQVQPYTLPNGSQGWLNKNSTIQYLTHFKNNTLYLNGETHLKTDNISKPITVICHGLSIEIERDSEVSIRGFEEDETVEVITLKGKVSTDIINQSGTTFFNIGTGEEISFDRRGKLLQSGVNNDLNSTAWITGELIFKNNTIEDLQKCISHYYDRPLKVNYGNILQCRFSGKYPLHDDASTMLKSIAAQLNIKYDETSLSYMLLGTDKTCLAVEPEHFGFE